MISHVILLNEGFKDATDCNEKRVFTEYPNHVSKLVLAGLDQMWYFSDTMKTELVTTLKRQATKILDELHREKEPVLITEHGKPSAYLIDVESFESLLRKVKLLEGLARGEKAIFENRVLTHQQAEDKMGRWLK